MNRNRIDWLRVVVYGPFIALGIVAAVFGLAFLGYVGPRLLSAALQFAQDNPWVLVLAVLALVAWIARAASKDNPTW